MTVRSSSLPFIRPLLCLVVLTLALITVACARRDQAGVEQQMEVDAQRRVYLGLAHPLVDGDQRLLAALPGARTRTMAFTVSPSGATPLAAPDAAAAWREEVVIFLALERAEGTAVYLLDPRRMRLDLVQDGTCVVHRGVLVSKALGIRDSALEVFRFAFTIAGAAITPTAHVRLTNDGGNALPVAVPALASVVYAHRLDEQRTRLMRLDADGGAPRPLLAQQEFDARHVRVDGDGVIFAANPDGAYRLYRCDLASGAMVPWEITTPAGDERAAVVFALGADGFAPQVAEIPGELTLAVVAALVEARNPAVMRRRALLAAALIEAHQLRLANLPTISLGAFYTPVVGVFTDPVGFTGDYLAEGVMRGLIGVMQPLLEWDRNHALSAAGRVRATIARDALAEALNQQQAEAALAFIAYQALHLRLVQDRALLAVAERAAAAQAHQQAAGHAGSEQRLLVEQELVARQSDVASDERWQRVQLDRLKGLCGLADSCPSVPLAVPTPWETVVVDDYPVLLRTALLNHPRLRAAHAALREAFFAGQAGSRYRPSLALSAGYAISGKPGSEPIDDFVSLGLSGNLPLAWFKDRDLQGDYLGQIAAALRSGEEAAALELRRDLADSWAAYHHARGQLLTQRAQLRSAQEQWRIAGLRAEREQAGVASLTVTGLLGFERAMRLAQRLETDVWREVAERYVRIVQSQGLANGLWRMVPSVAPDSATAPVAVPAAAVAPAAVAPAAVAPAAVAPATVAPATVPPIADPPSSPLKKVQP